jgi:hypothetical protein
MDTAVVIPETAVSRNGAEATVLVIENNKIVRRGVTLGANNPGDGTIAILSGLKAGERVIARASAAIEEGATVQIGVQQVTTEVKPEAEKK